MKREWHGLDLAAADPTIPVAVGGGRVTTESILDAAVHGVVLLPTDTRGVAELNRMKYGALVAEGQVAVLPGPGDPYRYVWWSPAPRAVLITAGARLSRSLRPQLNRGDITTTIDTAFAETLTGCLDAHWPTWLTPAVRGAYLELHDAGLARSVEVWHGDRLVGGTVGISFGRCCSMDTAFHRVPNMAKVALTDLARRLHESDASEWIDLQFTGPLTTSVKGVAVDRRDFLDLVWAQPTTPTELDTERRDARRLA